MDFRFSPPEEAFRQAIAGWLKGNLPENWTGERFTRSSTESDEGMNVYAEFARRLATKNWVAPHWPKEYGGLGLTHVEQLIFNEEMADANAPIGYSSIGVGCRPTIIVYGNEEQKKARPIPRRRLVPWLLRAERAPTANLQTRAVRDGDDYVSTARRSGPPAPTTPTG
jgi:alkylation response protein AidB-like acyl-CoA dehydrogenase